MNKKLTFSGGEPNITLDNLLRDPIANRAALFGLLLGLGGPTDLVISGAAVTIDPGVDADVTAGYVWLSGEILQVDAATVLETLATDLWEFQKVITFDSAGDKTFNDLTPRETYQKNRAVLVNVATITGMDAIDAPLLNTVIVSEVTARQAGLTKKIIPLGSWDMSADSIIIIPHGVTQGNIRSLRTLIKKDSSQAYRDLAGSTSGGIQGGGTDTEGANLTISRVTGGRFDTASYSNLAENRGYVVIEYIA